MRATTARKASDSAIGGQDHAGNVGDRIAPRAQAAGRQPSQLQREDGDQRRAEDEAGRRDAETGHGSDEGIGRAAAPRRP
jgi:hypothetical protein